jgi:hypothetical protein
MDESEEDFRPALERTSGDEAAARLLDVDVKTLRTKRNGEAEKERKK